MTQTILVVDDDRELRNLVKSYLVQEGFRVVTAADGREALFVAREELPDLIILDLMMPEMGGHDFIRIYHKEAAVPIILLTARLEESDKVLGLELGADDYVTKPFSLRELVARIRAVLRRTGKAPAQAEVLHAADGNALLETVRRHRNKLRLCVVDVDLPKRSGIECIKAMRTEGLSTPIIVITGNADAVRDVTVDARTVVLLKPFRMIDLGRLASRLVRTHARGQPAG